jgi:peptidylprolyl isomerase
MAPAQHPKKQLADTKQTVGNHLISLNQALPSSDSGSLSVSGQASSLGQLGSKDGQSQSSGNGSSSNGDIDPASFGQYNKYQNSPSALFGEIQVGNGAALGVGQKASIYYKVWLANGALVDQSPVSAGGQPQPFSFTLGAHQVIPGLEQGIAGMKAGSKRLIIVPPVVGYGSQGRGNVPSNAVLIFEVQLLNVQ